MRVVSSCKLGATSNIRRAPTTKWPQFLVLKMNSSLAKEDENDRMNTVRQFHCKKDKDEVAATSQATIRSISHGFNYSLSYFNHVCSEFMLLFKVITETAGEQLRY